MARGYFRTDKRDCLYCGKSGKTVKRGTKNHPQFLCEDCAVKYDLAKNDQSNSWNVPGFVGTFRVMK